MMRCMLFPAWTRDPSVDTGSNFPEDCICVYGVAVQGLYSVWGNVTQAAENQTEKNMEHKMENHLI